MASPFPSAAGDHWPSPSGGVSPPSPPPPSIPLPQRGWLAGLVSGAGRLLNAVLGPESSGSGLAAASSPSASSSPNSSRPPPARGADAAGVNSDHDNSYFSPCENNQSKQSGKEIGLKDCAEGSLTIVSEIDPKDAIMQLLMQENYSGSECTALTKIIQERVVDSNPGGVDPGGIALPISRQAGRQQESAASLLSPNTFSPATSSLPACTPDFERNSVMKAKGWAKSSNSKLTPTVQVPSTLNTGRIQSALKRSYSTAGDTLDESRRVRMKLDGNLLNITKFKQVNVVRNRAAVTSFEELTAKDPTADSKKLFTDAPLLGTDNLTFSNTISNGETAGPSNKPSTATAQPFGSTSCQTGMNHRGYDSTIFNPYSSKDLKEGFPTKVEHHMMELAQQKHDSAKCDEPSSVSKQMFKEDIEAAPSSSVGIQVGSSSRRRRRGTPTTTRSPAKSSRRQNNSTRIKTQNDLLEQSRLILMGHEEPDLGQTQKRPVGRPRRARGRGDDSQNRAG